MITVFIERSKDLSHLNGVVGRRLQAILVAGLHVFLGNAKGFEKANQHWFIERHYRQVTGFRSSSSPQNSFGNWKNARSRR